MPDKPTYQDLAFWRREAQRRASDLQKAKREGAAQPEIDLLEGHLAEADRMLEFAKPATRPSATDDGSVEQA